MDPARPLAGLVFVLTGTFERTHAALSGTTRVQGDVRLDEGKGAEEEAITSRGGTIKANVSKWTHALVVGVLPGFKKVLAARRSKATVLLLVRPFLDAIQRGAVPAAIEAAKIDPPLEIGQFSLGRSFGGGAVGGLVAGSTPEDFAMASYGLSTPREPEPVRYVLRALKAGQAAAVLERGLCPPNAESTRSLSDMIRNGTADPSPHLHFTRALPVALRYANGNGVRDVGGVKTIVLLDLKGLAGVFDCSTDEGRVHNKIDATAWGYAASSHEVAVSSSVPAGRVVSSWAVHDRALVAGLNSREAVSVAACQEGRAWLRRVRSELAPDEIGDFDGLLARDSGGECQGSDGAVVAAPPLAPSARGGSGSGAVVHAAVPPAAARAAGDGAGVVAEPCTVFAAPAAAGGRRRRRRCW